MTIIKKINFETDDKVLKSVLIEGSHINLVLLDEGKIFSYKNNKRSYDIIVVQFKYMDNIVSQAFYKSPEDFKDTWLPFDGIKGNVDDSMFYKYMDKNAFEEDPPFGNMKMMCISYILGGGIWLSDKSKYKDTFNKLRGPITISKDIVNVNFEDSLVINHYINYSVSRNYYMSNPDKKLRPKSPQWIKDSKKIKNEQSLFSAFDFSTKMNNSCQIEYTPPVIANYTSRNEYKEFYDKVDKSIIKVEEEISMCNIL